jgi:uncharacterized protein YbjT (DUF2867 family)
MTPLLVTGGTGTLGRAVVDTLRHRGDDPRILSRRSDPADPARVTGDLVTGAGLDEAVAGTAAIIHCATDVRAPRHDLDAMRHLLDAARRHGVPHLVYISIVGVDRVPLRYYRTKREVEDLLTQSDVPWTILRATQFHDLVHTVATLSGRLPVAVVPAATSFQPVDTRDVAARLVELAAGPPAGRADDFGGPEIRDAADLVRATLRAADRHRPVLTVRLPGRVAAGYRAGGHLTPGHADGQITYEQYLTERG